MWRSGACEQVKRRYSHTELAALIQQLHLDMHPAAPTTHHDHRLVFNFVSRSACLRTIFGPVVSQHVLSKASSRTDAATIHRSGCSLSLATARQLHLASGGVRLCHSKRRIPNLSPATVQFRPSCDEVNTSTWKCVFHTFSALATLCVPSCSLRSPRLGAVQLHEPYDAVQEVTSSRVSTLRISRLSTQDTTHH